MSSYHESESFREALRQHLEEAHNQDHPRANMWIDHHIQGVPRTLELLPYLEPYFPHPLTEMRVLDLGCASGSASVAFGWKGCAHVVGLDPSRDFLGLTLAQHRGRGQNLSIPFVQGDGGSLPFASESFDFCFCDWVIEHVSAPDRLAAEVYRTLAPGGVAYFSTNNRLWPWEHHAGLWLVGWLPHDWAARYVRWRGRHIDGQPYDVRLLTWWQFRNLLIEAGFTIQATWQTLFSKRYKRRYRLVYLLSRLKSLDGFVPSLYFLVCKE